MKHRLIILLLLSLLFLSCSGTTTQQKTEETTMPKKESNVTANNKKMTEEDLVEHVRFAINPKFQDWVLFKNGTYIIFNNADTIADIEKSAITFMQEFGPVSGGNPAGDFVVTHLNKTEGWSISGHGYGMYTYVHPSELIPVQQTDLNVGLLGRSKRDRDSKTLTIIHINRKTK